jgi:hypothetical protein
MVVAPAAVASQPVVAPAVVAVDANQQSIR